MNKSHTGESADQPLLWHKNLLDALINSTRDLIFLTDQENRLIAYNKAFEKTMSKIYGVEIETGASLIDYIKVKDDVKAANENFDRALSGEQFTRIQKYGDKKLERIYFELSFNPIRDPDNQSIVGVAVFIRDLTEQVQWENALKESESKYRQLFETVQDVYYKTDTEGKITEVSPSIERYSGYKPSEVIGNPVEEFYYYREDRKKLLSTIKRNGEVIDFEVRLKTKDDELAWTSVNAYLLKDESGAFAGIQGSLRDISERKKAELELLRMNNKLSRLNNQKDKLFSVIAHDLRNMISGLTGALQILREEVEELSREEIGKYVRLVSRNAENTDELLEDLLKWSRNQFESVDLQLEEVKPAELIDQVFDRIRIWATEKKIGLKKEIGDNIVIRADREMLKTVLRNLISNAIKFSKPGSEVLVKAVESDYEVRIEVIDQGIGITPEQKQKILSKEVNYTTPGTDGEKGSGLGIDLCIDFVEQHDGQLDIRSKPGKGSTFSVVMPAYYE